MGKTFYSNGKLLLSGEYVILDGAIGLAIPTKFGQSLEKKDTSSGMLEWKSIDEKGATWFEATYGFENLKEHSTSDKSVSATLKQLLAEAKVQNSNFLDASSGLKIETKLSFPRNWGLGTSSTLINNIAQWAQIDAYQLLWNAFGGSGYDIACAQHDSPILYQLIDKTPNVEKIPFDPSFKDSLFFVYLNQKKSSKEAIASYRKQNFDKKKLISKVSSITKKMAEASTLIEFESLLREHEQTISEVLDLPTIKTTHFSDYAGAVKSLGGWGGDFILVTGSKDDMNYFRTKGYNTIIPFAEMVLDR
nr:GYDIA family GHMP kinase [uncultured Allomuricauda sp.]